MPSEEAAGRLAFLVRDLSLGIGPRVLAYREKAKMLQRYLEGVAEVCYVLFCNMCWLP